MNNYIKIKSVTLAVKGKSILQKQGFNVSVEKTPVDGGCGYALRVKRGDPEIARALLAAAGIDEL